MRSTSIAELFAPPDEQWVKLDPAYLKARRITVLAESLVFFAIVALIAWFSLQSWQWELVCLGAAVAWMIFQYQRQGRVVRNWGYAERDTDLYVKRGLLVRKLMIVPYGRMQIVEVKAGPIERAFGVASVEMTTAAQPVTVPGLNATDAAALRDRLSVRGQGQQSGL